MRRLFVIALLVVAATGYGAPAVAAPVTVTNGTQFRDVNGNVVHAHGGGVLKVGSYYYWFGENRNANNTFRAVSAYRSAIKIAAGNAFEAHIGLAIALNELDETDEAVKEYRIGILQDMETEPILYYYLGEILEKAERKKEAIKAYSKYLKLDPEGELAGAAESIIEQLKSSGPQN